MCWKARALGAALLAGRGLEPCLEAPETHAKGFGLFQYESSPAFLERNADLSAEGALLQAMGRTGDALPDMTVLVTGYGRFGRALAQKLRRWARMYGWPRGARSSAWPPEATGCAPRR